MPVPQVVDLDVRDVVLTDSRGVGPLPLGRIPGAAVLTLIRHRY